MNLTAAFYCDRKLRRERIYHGGANAMQSAAGLVCIVVKFSARVECRKDHALCADALLMHSDRNPSAVVRDRGRTIFFQCDPNLAAHTRQMFIYGVINNFIY